MEAQQLNTYELSRNFWNWAFDNPEKIKPNHAAIYFFAIEHCNRLGGKIKFGFPSQMTMEAIGIRKHQTYSNYFNELIDYGFFKLIERSKNQYSANIISITHAMPKKGKALDKAFIRHGQSTGQSTGQSKDSINKQVTSNKETINNIISFLNEQTNRSYKPNTEKNKSLIVARLNDGYVEADFIQVIKNKVKDWKDDPKMSKYLRPETLFSNKFDGYLNEGSDKELTYEQKVRAAYKPCVSEEDKQW